VTVSGSVSVAAGIDVQANGFTITGGTLAMAGGTGAAARTISVASAATLTLATTLTCSTGLVKSGSGTLVLRGTNPLSGTATVSDGTLRLASESALGNATIAVGDAAVLKVGALVHSTVAGLDLAAAGKVDVNDGMMTVTSGLAPATLVARLIEGRGDGSWTGTSGITSSVAASDVAVSIPRAVGWLDNGDGSVTAAFAAPGDTNLDWQVDVLDASNFLSFGKFDSGLPAAWQEGDFNYDGVVDVLDAADFFGTGLYDAGSYNPPPGSVGAVAAVPEPSSVPVVACGLITAIGWHLRRLFGGVKAA
jgi:autotransporter-associated beta strand protein